MKIILTYDREYSAPIIVEAIGNTHLETTVSVARLFAREFLNSFVGTRDECLCAAAFACTGSNDIDLLDGTLNAEFIS